MKPMAPAAPRPPSADPPQASTAGFEVDSGFYFSGAAREKTLNLLLHLAPYSDALLLTADAGAGKSALLRLFRARAGDTWRICAVQAGAEIDAGSMLEALEAEFGRGAEGDRETRIRRLHDNLQALRRSGVVPIMLVDDAQLLSSPALSLLGQLAQPSEQNEKALGIVLCGEPELAERFTDPALQALRARISHSFDLPPLKEEETAQYIRQRLSAAGPLLDKVFTPSVIKFIHVAARGLPGRINEFAREVLQNHSQPPQTPEPAAGTVRAARPPGTRRWMRAAALLLGSGAVITVLTFQNRINDFVSGRGPGAPAQTRPAPPFEGSGGLPAAIPPQPAAAPGAAEAPVAPAPVPGVPDDGRFGRVEPTVEPAASVDDALPQAASQPITVPEAPAVAAAPPAAPVSDAAVQVKQAEVPPPAPAPAVSAAQPVATAKLAEPAAAAPAAPAPAPAQAEHPAPAAVPAPAISAVAPGSPPQTRGEDWLLARDPAHFTLQLLALEAPKAQAYIARHGIADLVAVYRTRANGKELLAVTYGDFPDREAAQQAAVRIKPRLDGVAPWPRDFRGVQAAIAAGRAQ